MIECTKEIACCVINEFGATVEIFRSGEDVLIDGTSTFVRQKVSVGELKAIHEPVEGFDRELYGGKTFDVEKNRHSSVEITHRFYFCPDDLEVLEKDDEICHQNTNYEVIYVENFGLSDITTSSVAFCRRVEYS